MSGKGVVATALKELPPLTGEPLCSTAETGTTVPTPAVMTQEVAEFSYVATKRRAMKGRGPEFILETRTTQ